MPRRYFLGKKFGKLTSLIRVEGRIVEEGSVRRTRTQTGKPFVLRREKIEIA